MENLIEIIENNKNYNGGGLAVNITGKYESNRHAIAKIEKYTFGEVVKKLKKKANGGFDISAKEFLNAYFKAVGEPEWHHAGFVPKSYGGGMKKTYFLDEIPTPDRVLSILKKASKQRVENLKDKCRHEIISKKENEFLKLHAKRFERCLSTPNIHCVRLEWEMQGKYGWFPSDLKYRLTEYVSGWSFENEKKRNEFLNISI